MDQTPEAVNHGRRLFVGAAMAAAAAAPLSILGEASAQAATVKPADLADAKSSFGPVRQINAGVLSTGYVEAGPADGTPVILMHGFPYDIHSYVEVAPLLAARGYRVIVPYFRGHGTTTFLSPSTPRNVDQVAFALDILALMDALKIDKAVLAGYDWGSRTADIIAAVWPKRVKALVSVTGYLITNLTAQQKPLVPKEENDWWYQYYFDTERGVLGLEQYRYELGDFIWQFNSPTWKFSAATYAQTAQAFNNTDYVAIVIGNYRWRQGRYPTEPEYADVEAILQRTPKIGVPTITVDGAHDPFTPAGDGASYRTLFTGKYKHYTFNVGHNVPQEAPGQFADVVVEADRL